MRQLLNRCFDIAFSLLALLCLAPLWLGIIVALLVDSGGPLFFRPLRLGRNGRTFRMFKFRTMVARKGVDGEEEFVETRVGRILRRYNFDDLPQFLNVFAGQMRVVGPRPENPRWRSCYQSPYDELLAVEPGVTGTTTLTVFDENHLLSHAQDRAQIYARQVLPLKLAGDLEYARQKGPYHVLAALLLIAFQILASIVRAVPALLRRPGKVVVDGAVVVTSVVLAHLVRLDVADSIHYLSTGAWLLVLLVALRLGTLYAFGAYRAYWRYTSMRDLSRIAAATTVGSIAFAGLLYAFNLSPAIYPRSVFFIEWSFTTLGLVGIRTLRIGSRRLVSSRLVSPQDRRRVLIYGAGDAGANLASSLLAHPNGRHPVAFVDDDASKCGALVHGIPVVGDGSRIKQVVEALSIDEVILAIPSATGEQVRNLIFKGENLPCRLTTLPSLKEILAGQSRDRIREIRVEDLLEREAACVDLPAIAELLSGQRILVTGAGGSIGSELCRQIVSFGPQELILVGHGENSVFEIQQELCDTYGFKAHAIVADIQDRIRLNRVFQTHRPTMVFHAAAHKHVPLMEQNPEEAVKNNILGTQNLAETAIAFGTQRFLMVSSDKAVNPTSVMGATKRVAEMVIQTMSRKPGMATRFTAVRFGNVLGSRGSLVPVLRKQIARGGPVTITHPDMERYFMTIPEAVQLMLQSCSMGEQGEVFVLDMGAPVKIVDLAHNLIRLSGLVVGQDIEIVYTGIRPGEKLYEELLTHTEGATATRHSQVYVVRPVPPEPSVLFSAIARLEAAALAGDQRTIRETLAELIPNHKLANVRCVAENGHHPGIEARENGQLNGHYGNEAAVQENRHHGHGASPVDNGSENAQTNGSICDSAMHRRDPDLDQV